MGSRRAFLAGLIGVGTVIAGSVIAGCSTPEAAAEKTGSDELRTDLDPLVSRFPELADASAAIWMSGTFGDSRVPGPSTYWIDAIITVPSAQIADFQDNYDLVEAEPSIVGPLQGSLPSEVLLGSAELNSAFGATVLIAAASAKVVLSWIGE